MNKHPALDQVESDSSAKPRRTLARRGPAPLALEPRVMFDGAAADAAVAAAKAAVDIPTAEPRDASLAGRSTAERADLHIAAAVLPPVAQRSEIVFIEDNVQDFQKLVAGVNPGVEVVVLDHTKDGLQQMIAALDGHAPVDAIHLVTHGDRGEIELGASVISGANIDGHAGELAEIGRHLNAGGDILVYGCDVASGDQGAALVDRIAQLTGADVAASTDITGSSAFGGDWDLEARSGQVDTATMALDRAGWSGELEFSKIFDAERRQLIFQNAKGLTSAMDGTHDNDVMVFSNVITIGTQSIDALVTTKLNSATISAYDAVQTTPTDPGVSSHSEYFQPNVTSKTAGGNATFTITFYLSGTHTTSNLGTVATLQNVVVNSYDIDSAGGADRQFQSFQGFASYELAQTSNLSANLQTDGKVTFLATTKNKNDIVYTDAYRVRVYYDQMSTFTVNAGINGAAQIAYFAFDFSMGPAWEGPITTKDSPAWALNYGATNFVESAANDGSISAKTTITLKNGTFAGADGQDLPGVGFAKLPTGLTAHVKRTSATTAELSFTGNAQAHASANDVSDFGITFGNAAFTNGNAAAVTGASRADLVIDFADPPADDTAPVVAPGQSFSYAENRGAGAGAIGAVAATDAVGVTAYRFAANQDTTSADGRFSIDGNGRISLTPAGLAAGAASNDYEIAPNSFTYGVQAGDAAGNWSSAVNVTLNVTNVDEVAPAFASGASATPLENQDVLYTAAATDLVDFTDKAVTYSLKTGVGDVSKLAIGASDGVVRLASGKLDFETKPSYSFTVIARDASGNTREQAVTVSVADVDENGPTVSIDADLDALKAGQTATLEFTFSEDVGDSFTLDDIGVGAGSIDNLVKVDGTHYTATYTPQPGQDATTVDIEVGAGTFQDAQANPNTAPAGLTLSVDTNVPVITGAASEIAVPEGTMAVGSFGTGEEVSWAIAGGEDAARFTIGQDGKLAFAAAPDFEAPGDGTTDGTNTYFVQIAAQDPAGNVGTRTVKVIVTDVNEAPRAAPDAISTPEDTAITGVLPAAIDPEGDHVGYALADNGAPAHGSVVVNADGSYTYTPDADYHGADSFRYTIGDGQHSASYQVAVTVVPVNDAPLAANAAIETMEDTPVTSQLPAGSDIDSTQLGYSQAGAPAHGQVEIGEDGSYTYTPNPGYSGADSFKYAISDGDKSTVYTVAVTVDAVNHVPGAAGDSIATLEDTPKTGQLPAATDADGDKVLYAKAGDASHGTVVIADDGSYTYTPNKDYFGADSFGYSIDDQHGGTRSYTVTVDVTPVNDPPLAADDSIVTPEDTAKSGQLPAASDAEHANLVYFVDGKPGHGTVDIDPFGAYTYTPAANYSGPDSFTYTISDGEKTSTYKVDVRVDAVNHAPTAADGSIVTPQDTARQGQLPAAGDAEGDAVTYAAGAAPQHGQVSIDAKGGYSYTPAAGYHGPDSFGYTVSDGDKTSSYTVQVTVKPDGAPVGQDASIRTNEDTTASGSLPAAVDPDGDKVVYAAASNPAHGSVTVGADGSYVYTPAANYNGSDAFSYTVSDGKGGSSTYAVAVTVDPVNDAPAAANAAITTREDTSVTGTLPAATDIDGDQVGYAAGAAPQHGQVSIDAKGGFTYTPSADYNGKDSFTYTVSDGKGGSNTYTVDVTVTPVNDAPSAHGGAQGQGTVGEAMDPVQLPAFTDVDGPSITYTAKLSDGGPLPGWLSFDPATHSFGGTPPQGSVGSYAVVVTGSDGELSDSATVTITVVNPPLPSQAVAIAAMSKDTGASSTDFVTSDGSAGRMVTGSIGAPLGHNEAVQVSFDAGASWATAATNGTSWSIVDGGAHTGNWTIEARVVNTAASLAGNTATRDVVLDVTAPAAPTVDNITTTSTTPTLTGAATVGNGDILRVNVNGAVYEVAAPGGTWTLDLASSKPVEGTAQPLTVGQNYDVTASVTDLAGNTKSGVNAGLVSVSSPVKPAETPPAAVQAAPVPAPAAAPVSAPVADPTPVGQAVDTRARSESQVPGSVVGNDSLLSSSGQGVRASEEAPVLDLRAASLSDVYTRTEGFRTVVAKAEEPALVLFQGVPDQFVETGTRVSLTVPADAFAHTQPKAIVRLVAVQQDGQPLPGWVQFNGQTGQFTGDAPKGLKGELRVKLIARDLEGREATALFRINVGQNQVGQNRAVTEPAAPSGKPGLTQQLRASSGRNR